MIEFRLEGRRALITGSSKGIGFGIATAYAKAGADVVLLARNEAELAEARNQISKHGTKIDTVSFDLMNVREIPGAFRSIVTDFGPIDILVNNAGTNIRGPAEDISGDDWQKVMDLNLNSVFALSQAFAKERIERKEAGRILNIASVLSFQARPGVSAYIASKGGIRQLTLALAVDWAKYGILVNAIAPGYIATPLNKPLLEDQKFDTWVKERCPLGRWGTPDDIALPAVFLVSDAARFITGQILCVDGGWLARF